MIKIIICEDNTNLRQSLSLLLKSNSDFEVVAEFSNCYEIKEACMVLSPDIIFLDIDMPIVNGLEGLKLIRSIDPNVIVIMLTVFDDNENLFQAICAGASGYLLKSTTPSHIIEAVYDARNGGAPMTPSIAKKILDLFSGKTKVILGVEYKLTPRELEILKLLVDGNSYKMIAAAINLTIETVKTHLKNIYSKLQVHSQTEAVGKAIREKLV